MCAAARQRHPSECKSRPANSVAPAGSYRSGGGGNEAVGAFETRVALGGAASRQAVTRVNAEQASKGLTWEPTLLYIGEGRRRRRTGKRVELAVPRGFHKGDASIKGTNSCSRQESPPSPLRPR